MLADQLEVYEKARAGRAPTRWLSGCNSSIGPPGVLGDSERYGVELARVKADLRELSMLASALQLPFAEALTSAADALKGS